jgi:predicted nucleic acid-binding protein
VNRIVFRKGSPLRFFVLVFALSAPIWLLEPRDWRITASVGTPLVAALILVYREDGRAGTRRLLRRVFDQKRIKAKIWYVPVIFLLPAIYLLTYGVTRLTRLPLPDKPYYALDRREPEKREHAREVLRRVGAGTAALPAQVLSEFGGACLRKLEPRPDPTTVRREVERLMLAFPVLALTGPVVLEALRGVGEHMFSYYDAQIWAVARLGKVAVVLSKIHPVRAASNMAKLYAPTPKLWSCLGSHGGVE